MLINDLDWSNFCIGLINELDSTGLIFEWLDRLLIFEKLDSIRSV